MQVSLNNFGDLIAFVLPGLVLLLGLSVLSATVRGWFGQSVPQGATLGGALLLLVSALAAGILLDAVRIQTVDRIHFMTGVVEPSWSFDQLDEKKFKQFEGIMENYFRFHQFYGNLFVGVLCAYILRLVALRKKTWPPGWLEVGVVLTMIVAWTGSRTELQYSSDAIEQLVSTEDLSGGTHGEVSEAGEKEGR